MHFKGQLTLVTCRCLHCIILSKFMWRKIKEKDINLKSSILKQRLSCKSMLRCHETHFNAKSSNVLERRFNLWPQNVSCFLHLSLRVKKMRISWILLKPILHNSILNIFLWNLRNRIEWTSHLNNLKQRTLRFWRFSVGFQMQTPKRKQGPRLKRLSTTYMDNGLRRNVHVNAGFKSPQCYQT